MKEALALGLAGIAYGVLAHRPGDCVFGICLIGLAGLVLIEEHERKLVRRKNRASDSLNHTGCFRVGYDRAKDLA